MSVTSSMNVVTMIIHEKNFVVIHLHVLHLVELARIIFQTLKVKTNRSVKGHTIVIQRSLIGKKHDFSPALNSFDDSSSGYFVN